MKIKGRGGVGERGRVLKVKADDVVGNIFSLCVFFFLFLFRKRYQQRSFERPNKNFLACFLLPRAILIGRYSCILFRQTEIQFPLSISFRRISSNDPRTLEILVICIRARIYTLRYLYVPLEYVFARIDIDLHQPHEEFLISIIISFRAELSIRSCARIKFLKQNGEERETTTDHEHGRNRVFY